MIKIPSLDKLKRELPILISNKLLNQLEDFCNFIGISKEKFIEKIVEYLLYSFRTSIINQIFRAFNN